MNRIETALQALQEKKEKAFITYITAGLPDYDKTKAIIKAQEAAGTDIIELGIPFSDPVADGPVIQAASYEAILGGANLEKTFTCMKEMRDDGVQIPIVFMMYYNTVLHYGRGKICKRVQCLRGGWTDHSGSAAGRAGRTPDTVTERGWNHSDPAGFPGIQRPCAKNP